MRLVAAILFFANLVASNVHVFSPSDKMRAFNKNDFGTNSEYIMKLIVDPAIVMGFGIVITITFICWSVCRACKCCCDCRQPTNGNITAYVILLLAMTAGCIATVISGFTADTKLSAALSDVPALVRTLDTWVTESKRKSDGVNGACEQLKINANTLLNTACGDVKTEINTFANTVQTNIVAINDILNTMDFDSVQRDVDSTIDTTKEPLHIAMIVILSVALFCASMTTIMCIQHTCYEAGSISRCLVRSIATIMISTIFMVWTMSAVLLALSSAMADFCVNPANNIINVAGITDTTTKYFLRCNYVSPALVWPFQADTDAIISTINEAVNKITTVKTCYTTTTPQTCDQTCITGMEQQLNTTILNFMELNHSFVAEDGFFQQFACSTVNGLFQVTTYKTYILWD